MSKPPRRFQQTALEFIEFLMDYFEEYKVSTKNLDKASALLEIMSSNELVQQFVKTTFVHWDRAHSKSWKYYQSTWEHSLRDHSLRMKISPYLSTLFIILNDDVNTPHEDKDDAFTPVFWEYIFALIRSSINAINEGHITLPPSITQPEDIHSLAIKWNVTLSAERAHAYDGLIDSSNDE